jgi:hypothetical protein
MFGALGSTRKLPISERRSELMSMWKLAPAGAVALAFAFSPAQAAPAGPAMAAPAEMAKSAADGVTQVQYRRGHGHRHRGWGRGVGIGLGLGILGGIVAAEAYRPRPGYYYDDYAYEGPYYYPSEYAGDPRVVCAQNFRSFEWHTGLYTTYSGEKRLCPYLR